MITQLGHCRAFVEIVGDIQLFPYQVSFLESCLSHNRVVGVFSRQTGKTTLMSLFPSYLALQNDNYQILLIAPTDRQAGELFTRLREAAESSSLVKDFIESSTLREIKFKNGSKIRAMPTGDFGHNIRGQTADLIILEESSFIKTEIVNQVILPMIASKGSNGRIIQIGTPFGKNHFYEASMSDKYAVHQYDYTHSPLITGDFIEEQRQNLTHLEFAMEYEAQFIEDSDAYFSSELIKSSVEDYESIGEVYHKSDYYLGVDFARLGEDSSVFIVIEKRFDSEIVKITEIIETKHKRLTDAVGRIKLLNEKYNFKKIYLDETGMGAGPSDILIESLTGKVEPITFTIKSKMDIYSNLKVLLEKGTLKLPNNNKKLMFELLDLRYEVTSSGQMKIHHSDRGHDDYVDALALACYYFRPKKKSVFTIA